MRRKSAGIGESPNSKVTGYDVSRVSAPGMNGVRRSYSLNDISYN
jgi:hypothetical protein